MSATTVQIRMTTSEQLREFAALTGVGRTELLTRAVDSFYRSVILADADIARAGVGCDVTARNELTVWDETLADGLDVGRRVVLDL